MDLEKDLENLRRTCEMQVNPHEIVITSLEACKFTADHISVRAEAEGGAMDPVTSTVVPNVPTSNQKSEGYGHAEFSKEKDVPDIMSVKVYDFVMSKDRTLPVLNLPEYNERRLRQKWFWIGGLGLSTCILLVIIIVIILTFPGKRAVLD